MRANPSFASRVWIAAKPKAWPKILIPWAVASAIAFGAAVPVDPSGVALSLAYSYFGTLFILFINDWADQDVDRVRRELFPDSSPKTIVDGILSARQVLIIGLVALALTIVSAIAAGIARQDLAVTGLGLIGIALFSSYSVPPVRLNDRGGGELLEAIGVALVLPLFCIFAQVPRETALAVVGQISTSGFGWCFFLLALAGAIASGIADETSDRVGAKRTWVVLFGNRRARASVEALVAAAALSAVVFAIVGAWQFLLFAAAAGWAWSSLRRSSEQATHPSAPGLRAYKGALRAGIALATLLYCGGLLLRQLEGA